MRKASIPHKNPEIKEITTKINADRDFIVVACYTTPDTEAKEHFVLFIGTFHQGSAKNNEDIAFYLDLHYAFSVDMRQDKILENFIAIWKKTHDNGSHSYYKTDTVDDFYSSLCYANELFVRIITGQSLDNSAIESAQAWFQRNLWERQVQIGICLDRQPNAIFNAGAEILYRQQMGNRPQDIYSPPEQKQ